MRSTLIAGLSLLALAGCVETPPYVAASVPPPPSGPYPSGIASGAPAMPAPPIAAQLTDVTASHVTRVPGHPDCSDYSVTGTLAGRVETVTGRSCRLADGGLQVTERDPVTGQVSHTTYPAPPAQQQGEGQGAAGGVNYGTTAPYAVAPEAYGYGYDYPLYAGYPYAYDPFFFGYPFFGWGYGFGPGFGWGFHGGYGWGFHGGYGYGFHGGYGGYGGFHGGYGGFHGGYGGYHGGGGFGGGGFHGGGGGGFGGGHH